MTMDELIELLEDGECWLTKAEAKALLTKLRAAEGLADFITKGIRVGMEMEYAEHKLIEYRNAGREAVRKGEEHNSRTLGFTEESKG